MSLLGDARNPTYAHPLVLGQYFDQVYHQGRFPSKLPKRQPGQAKEITQERYDREIAEICARLRSFNDPVFSQLQDLAAYFSKKPRDHPGAGWIPTDPRYEIHDHPGPHPRAGCLV